MIHQFEELAKAKAAISNGRMADAAEHIMSEWDDMLPMMFGRSGGEMTVDKLEDRRHRLGRIPEKFRPSLELLRRVLVLRDTARSGQRTLTRDEVGELITAMERVKELADKQLEESEPDGMWA